MKILDLSSLRLVVSAGNQDNDQWYKDGVKLIKDNLKVKPNMNTAKSAIIFVGDGMGITTVTAARILDGQMKGQTGEENVLSWEEFPWSGLSKTYAVDVQGQIRLLQRRASYWYVVGMNDEVTSRYCATASADRNATSILSLAEKAGMSTGFVSTARATHATPACSYAHSVDRHWESDADKKRIALDDASSCKDIALQLAEYSHGDGIEVIFAGGRRELMHRNQTDPEYPDKKGERLDGRDLIKEWVAKHPNSQYVWNQTGGRIDHGHHANWAVKAINDAVAMNKAVSKAKEMTDKDETLITVTADHSHVFTIGAYPKRGNPMFTIVREADGELALDSDGKTYTSLGYANGKGGLNGSRPDLRGVDTTDKNYRTQATVKRSSETHGTEDVGVYADGPGAYLFHGVFEQQYVFHVMDHALCLSSSKQESCDKHVKRGGKGKPSAAFFIPVPSLYLLVILAYWITLTVQG
ncbi:hypothetical protein OS493_038579 [Desmophyllum pertusum]|uniref:alkaline phosphatase n=1 Tax=Desmophyllum pertusum TaxID=174260 RepID=A0A9X0CGW0_9CNID|nr:hypothetical protein OS493_038579 [Desmophyllum pertusum]